MFDKTGFRVLDREAVKLEKEGESFYVSGHRHDRAGELASLLREAEDGFYSIFLCHKPALVEGLNGLNVVCIWPAIPTEGRWPYRRIGQ